MKQENTTDLEEAVANEIASAFVLIGKKRKLFHQMTTKEKHKAVVEGVAADFKEALQGRGNLSREDLEYVAQKIATLRDERLKQCITELIGWDDDLRAKLETAAAISVEVIKEANPSKLVTIAKRVEFRFHMRNVTSTSSQ